MRDAISLAPLGQVGRSFSPIARERPQARNDRATSPAHSRHAGTGETKHGQKSSIKPRAGHGEVKKKIEKPGKETENAKKNKEGAAIPPITREITGVSGS